MIGWEQDKQWADKFLRQIKAICGVFLISSAPMEQDREENTDLIVLKLDAVRIACRIRRAAYADRYGDEFTIRCSRPSGNETELNKIIAGWGDYFFYGFGDDATGKLKQWILGDLKVFRKWHSWQIQMNQGASPGDEQENGDGSSKFRAFKIVYLPDEFIVASNLPKVSEQLSMRV